MFAAAWTGRGAGGKQRFTFEGNMIIRNRNDVTCYRIQARVPRSRRSLSCALTSKASRLHRSSYSFINLSYSLYLGAPQMPEKWKLTLRDLNDSCRDLYISPYTHNRSNLSTMVEVFSKLSHLHIAPGLSLQPFCRSGVLRG